MDSELMCVGCGALLQDTDPQNAGFLPSSALKKALSNEDSENNDIYCKRCFRLRNYNELVPVKVDNNDFLALLNSLAGKKALIVNVVDLFDFSNSLIPSLKRFIGNNDFILVGNKFDLFPKNSRQSRIKDWMRQEANRVGLRPKKIFLISAAKKNNLEQLIHYLAKVGQTKDIYFVGMTNVGKSTLLNAILEEMGDIKNLLTTSHFPGTTLDRIEIPLDTGYSLVDTPGIMAPNQLATRLTAKELALVSPHKPLRPVTYQLKPGNTIFVGGFGRIDYLKGEATSFTVYAARGLYLHRTKTENADEFYKKHVGELLLPPFTKENDWRLKSQEWHTEDKSDLLFGGLCFITVPKDCVVKTYTPEGIGLGIRRSLI